MDEATRRDAEHLRSMTSAEAAEWLIAEHPSGLGLRLVKHRSWERPEQERLADHYLAEMPFAASWPYEVLLSVMAVERFLRIAEAHFPSEASAVNLALYHLSPALRAASKSDRDVAAVTAFLNAKGV